MRQEEGRRRREEERRRRQEEERERHPQAEEIRQWLERHRPGREEKARRREEPAMPQGQGRQQIAAVSEKSRLRLRARSCGWIVSVCCKKTKKRRGRSGCDTEVHHAGS